MPGAIADLFESMGGVVDWIGKPYTNKRSVYDIALGVEGGNGEKDLTDLSRVCMVGDSLVTDVTGAFNAGLGGVVWVTEDGVHCDDSPTQRTQLLAQFRGERDSSETTLVHYLNHFYSSLTESLTKNEFYLLRHGNSEANREGIISSDPKISCEMHGLTALGQEQAIESGERFRSLFSDTTDGSDIVIHTSDFKRAVETARIFGAKQGVEESSIIFEKRLRERNFGELNGGKDDMYTEVWKKDEVDNSHTEFGVEVSEC